MVDNSVIYGLINPVPAMPEAEQRALLSVKFEVKEWFVVGKDGDLCDLVKLFRPGRMWAVAYTALMGEQERGKDHRVETMIATKVAAHKRGSAFIEASGRRSDKDWRAMKRDGEAMCARWAKGRKSVLNAKRGAKPWTGTRETKEAIREEWYVKPGRTVDDAVAAIKKRLRDKAPGRTVLYREFGLPVMKKR
jgi:hypothetical protein